MLFCLGERKTNCREESRERTLTQRKGRGKEKETRRERNREEKKKKEEEKDSERKRKEEKKRQNEEIKEAERKRKEEEKKRKEVEKENDKKRKVEERWRKERFIAQKFVKHAPVFRTEFDTSRKEYLDQILQKSDSEPAVD